MLEGLATWVLNTYLGQYLENLNTDQLSIGLLQGEVELENLPLRKDAFANLDLPLEVKAGFVGKIKLKIPVRRLRSEPWVIFIEKLYVVIGPSQQVQFDEVGIEQTLHDRKLSQLDAFEARWRAEREAKQESSYYASSYSSWLSYGTSLVANIVENLQLVINDVHIRYEGSPGLSSKSYSWGITIDSLTAKSANKEWNPSFVTRDISEFTRKLIDLQNFAIYWDSQVQCTMDNVSLADLASFMESHQFADSSSKVHQYLLEHICAQARLQQNCSSSSLRSRNSPRFVCDLILDKFPFSLSEVQYRECCAWIRELERLNLAQKFDRWRPPCKVRGHAKEWWQFAIHCHLDEIHKTYDGRSWEKANQRAKDIVLYVEVYRSHLLNPVILSPAYKTHKEKMEEELSFEELKVLREIVMERIIKEEDKQRRQASTDTAKGQSLLQRWFPLWSGWYAKENILQEEEKSDAKTLEEATELEEEILDVLKDTVENNTFLKRDVVFARLNFELKCGSFTLKKSMPESSAILPTTMLELEFESVQICLDSRPRTNSVKFNIQLGAMFLRDKMTTNSIFPVLVSPHSKSDKVSCRSHTSTVRSDTPLFDLTYEKKPFGSTADYKLHIMSQSLDMVYNPNVIKTVVEFFTVGLQTYGMPLSRHSELKLTAAAKNQYEKLKQQTKMELKKNWDHIMEGNRNLIERWDVLFDISAPQILVPENIMEINTNIVIFDFGRFQFSNASSKIQQKAETDNQDNSDDEDFKTPCSSPPDKLESTSSSSMGVLSDQEPVMTFPSEITENLLHKRMYDKYTLELRNLQVLILKAKDNWQFARLRGTSYMHILDKFDINLQFERRTVYTADPQWPSATLSGSLPKLCVHVNEMKIKALHNCLINLGTYPLSTSLGSGQSSLVSSYSESVGNVASMSSSTLFQNLQSSGDSTEMMDEDFKRDVQEESRLLIMQFSVDQMSLAVESRGRSIAELQVTGVNTMFTKRPYDTSLALTVHGLLLVDAMQMYGQDFELLLASHKNVSIDSVSGRLCDSEGPSPTSPASPTTSPKTSFTSPTALNFALSTLQTPSINEKPSQPVFTISPMSPTSVGPPHLYSYDDNCHATEALISIEIVNISPNCPSNESRNEALRIGSVQFNNLDIIANQETLIELLGFVSSVIPKPDEDDARNQVASSVTLIEDDRLPVMTSRTEITFDFHHLSVLLLRVVNKDTIPSAKKVAVAAMSGARIWATLGTTVKVQGSLGSLQVLNLTPEGRVHRRVLSLGQDLGCEKEADFFNQADFYQSAYDNMNGSDKKAFSFVIEQPEAHTDGSMPPYLNVMLEMASVCYVHSTLFLNELTLCVTEFQTYMSNFASTIKIAATEVALDIVNRGTDVLTTSLYAGIQETMKVQERNKKVVADAGNLFNVELRLTICVETPVVIFPRTNMGSELLVGHLGQITVSNMHNVECTSTPIKGVKNDMLNTVVERITVKIRDINLYTMTISNSDVDPNLCFARKTSFPASCIHTLYPHVSEAEPVLHETTIELIIDRIEHHSFMKQSVSHLVIFLGDELFSEQHQSAEPHQALQITCKVVVPLKISLSRQQYQQILETLSTLAVVDDDVDEIIEKNLSNIAEDKEVLQQSVSALKLDDILKPRLDSRSNSSDLSRKVFMPIYGYLEVPTFQWQLKGNTSNGEQELVLLSFKDFFINYSKLEPFIANIEMSLQTLLVEDLLQDPDSKHRNLMVSVAPSARSQQSRRLKLNFLSNSCPNVFDHEPVLFMHQSLPEKLETPNIFLSFHKQKEKTVQGVRTMTYLNTTTESYPSTPPPSPSAEWSAENLVTDTLVCISILLIDSRAADFAEKYKSMNRIIDIDFNCLETTINLQSWVAILDFFGDSGSATASSSHSPRSLSRQSSIPDIKLNMSPREPTSSEIQLEVRSLSLILNTETHELARANVSSFNANASTKNGNFNLHGKLGSFSLYDLTPHGHLYSERFSTTGDEALDFIYSRHGNVNSYLSQDNDIRLKIKMSSVRYIHTQRFPSDLTKFFNHFNQLQGVAARFQTSKSTSHVNEKAQRSSHILLDIQADSPTICIPQHSSSPSLLIIDLGKLTITNTFLYSGSKGTISKRCLRSSFNDMTPSFLGTRLKPRNPMTSSIYGSLDEDLRLKEMLSTSEPSSSDRNRKGRGKRHDKKSPHTPDASNENCLLDVMYIDLADVDLYSARRIENTDKITKSSPMLLKFSSYAIEIQEEPLLKEKCKLKLQVERNLDGHSSHAVPDMSIQGVLTSVHCSLDVEQYKLVRGLLSYNLGEVLDNEDSSYSSPFHSNLNLQAMMDGNIWMCTAFEVDLDNVTLELLQRHKMSLLEPEKAIAKVDFIKSKFIYESYSDSFKDIDLVSHEILISDHRFRDAPVNARPNVFTNILQPTSRSSSDALQAEFHYRATKDFVCFTILLNNMRLMTIFDWWTSVFNFICTPPDPPQQGLSNQPKAVKKWIYSGHHASPLSVSTGILTKRAPLFEKEEFPMEVKINITDTEVIVVEDASLWDTNAVILKSTAVISYRPNIVEKPLSCSLQSLEVFSCILGVEEDTALSIIDPVTVNIELKGKNKPSYSGGLLDATTTELDHVLEVSMHNLNIRLSYHDIQMFLQILDSLPRQTSCSLFQGGESKMWPANCPAAQISKLEDLGFSKADCVKAYIRCKGNLNEAALWLTLNVTSMTSTLPKIEKPTSSEELSKTNINLGGFEVRIMCCCMCLIDDCKDADVPLVEITLSGFYIEQFLDFEKVGRAHFQISSDYYNRSLSGWEPMIEPWKCNTNWTLGVTSSEKSRNLHLNIQADTVVNINMTSALIDLCKNVTTNWTEDYYSLDKKNRSVYGMDEGLAILVSNSHYRRRSPFIPFALKNDTGCTLWFTTLTTSPNKLALLDSDQSLKKYDNIMWTEVRTGETTPFTFEGREKLRHRDTHELKIHQLLVRVEGWQAVAPVSVDKVGVYFRHAKPQVNRSASIYTEIPPARIVFAVTLEGSAQKLITVRSALLLRNQLEEMVEVKLENTAIHLGGVPPRIFTVRSQATVPIPLTYVGAQILVRPVERWSVLYGNRPIVWQDVTPTNPTKFRSNNTCAAIDGSEFFSSYRFCVCIKRQHFPPDRSSAPSSVVRSRGAGGTSSQQIYIHPGHIITLVPPAVMMNLLPYDLHYEILGTSFRGCIRPGKSATLHMIDISKETRLNVALENFLRCDTLTIQPQNANYIIPLRMYDSEGRVLELYVKVMSRMGGALKIQVMAAYWLVNKTGLPLIFRQDASQVDAAGQFKEHEIARSVTPLLFSFPNQDAPQMCVMRVGSSLHSSGHAHWCARFHLEKGVRVRRLRVSPLDSRPDWVYNIGIDVRMGKGRYRDAHIVILSPRFQLDNLTSHKLEIAQKYSTMLPPKHSTHLQSTPTCTLPFHWPRLDLDQLLCVRLKDVPSCHWCGGFPIEKVDSFHINMRRDDCVKRYFLRVEIILQGATYFVVFTDADKIPPPFRIDNFSQVPITYYQEKVNDEQLKTVVRPNTSIPYAWDEATLKPSIVCCAPGGDSATYDMNMFGDGKKLTYENFIYIAFTATFSSEPMVLGHLNQERQELVLDVPMGQPNVILSRKEPGKRSQLWRMTRTGMLQHEGSSPPCDPRKSHSKSSNQFYVLDIAGLGLQPDQFVPLMIRKPDERRHSTQTWEFTDDGRLSCTLKNMYVQASNGFDGLIAGNNAVLGPKPLITFELSNSGIPAEQAVSRQRLWPGSGMLAIKVIADGPTRVLHIIDIKQVGSNTSQQNDWVIVTEKKLPKLSVEDQAEETNSKLDVYVTIKIAQGIGISIVNKVPEELVYIALCNIMFEYTKTMAGLMMDGSIENIQVDNQLFDTEIPVLLFLTPTSKEDNHRHLPAVHFTAHKMPSKKLKAHIFKHLMITFKNVTVQLEEQLLWKLLQFFGYSQPDDELEKLDDDDLDMRKALTAATSANAERFYFTTLKIMLSQVRLSVHTASRLPADLQAIKNKLDMRLIKFEDAQIELDPFIRVHPFETKKFLIDSIWDHYVQELKSQAAKILGAVDFLGNPLGLMNDVTEGISSLVVDGSIGGLLKNVTHGLSNSAAKVTGSLSDGLGFVTMDDKHAEHRQQIWKDHRGGGSDHLVAGLMGLGYGLMGGVTSLITQTYKGAANEGIPGFFSGLGKGLVGTVAKPAVGVLDFATGAASAVRDTSKSSVHNLPCKVRPTRLCLGPGGLLCCYSKHLSDGQSQLYSLNKKYYNELFIAYERLYEGILALISSERVILLSKGEANPNNIIFTVNLCDLQCCKLFKAEEDGKMCYYIELMIKANHQTDSVFGQEFSHKRPKVVCDTKAIALKVAQQINYAKSLYEERKHTLPTSDDSDVEN